MIKKYIKSVKIGEDFMFKVKSFDGIHPNPLMYRKDYIILDGIWDFFMDYNNTGEIRGYQKFFPVGVTINVPYSYLSESSGIHIKDKCDHVWYHRTIEYTPDKNFRTFIHFEGSDNVTKLYINGKYVGKDRGGYHRISFDITDYLKDGTNDITVKCNDNMSVLKPRGKQRFRKENFWCWYEETTGIWKSVWLEKRTNKYIESFKITPSFKNKSFNIELLSNDVIDDLSIKLTYKEKVVQELNNLKSDTRSISIDLSVLDEFHPWETLNPELYDLEFILNSEYGTDTVLSYAGLRDITISSGKIYLNDKELYQKLILDQGYIEHGDMTLTKDELENDIKSMIDMGFNGARKHQKFEAEIFYSLADFYGYLIWAEMPSMYLTTISSGINFKREWMYIVKQSYNHPSIITYTPFNESWGIWGIDHKDPLTRLFVNQVYKMTKAYDKMRPVTTNDGWSHMNGDIITLHLYNQDKESFKYDIDRAFNENFVNYKKGRIFVLRKEYLLNKPVLLDEFGGTSFVEDKETFGYGESVKNLEEFKERLKALFGTILDDDRFQGYCYTQLSDVRQEMNGLYTMDRKIKVPNEIMKEIQRSN